MKKQVKKVQPAKIPMFWHMCAIRATSQANGNHFFDRSTMRFFNSRVVSPVINGCYFVTAERFDEKSPFLFTVRKTDQNGNINKVGEFQGFKTAQDAKEYAKTLPFGYYKQS